MSGYRAWANAIFIRGNSENAHVGGVFKIILISFGLKADVSDDMGTILLSKDSSGKSNPELTRANVAIYFVISVPDLPGRLIQRLLLLINFTVGGLVSRLDTTMLEPKLGNNYNL